MAEKIARWSLVLALVMSVVGCTPATTRVRQDDGTYKTRQTLIRWSPESYRSFTCQEDYMVATTLFEVTYEWPRGQGRLEDIQTVTFKNQAIDCTVRGRVMSVNGQPFAEFEAGDHVRLTPDGRVLVDGVERSPAGEP
jgi:hypothetical protein